ncbi:MAG: hypothetical protein HZB41_05400 [Ignavibacteriae bacterium]|nr:hypothetical protein [Ignavibacteriota bacterium]
MNLDKVIDTFMFREGTEDEAEGNRQPTITTGSVVWGVILRTAIIMLLSLFLIEYFDLREYWWLLVFILWVGAAYPGWRQYQKFQNRIKSFREETLCGSCIHLDISSQLCKILDEHPTKDYIPCEGASWEPIHFDSEVT